eukprot:comp25241_c0_seq1/m.46974 comp25241_c0_seq1/g.46974  ORF comp25241_c0_seq1/g.46974 comp25241_c0_seq1/m.46974 type:complete len:115 (-) comp25241_c0_seq1:257-601(-)
MELPYRMERQASMPVKMSARMSVLPPENMRVARQVSFKETIEEYPTYEKYNGFFSEYDRRPIHRQKNMTESQVKEIFEDLKQLRDELFPDGNPFQEGSGRQSSDASVSDLAELE